MSGQLLKNVKLLCIFLISIIRKDYIRSLINHDEVLVTNKEEIANILNIQFKEVFS